MATKMSVLWLILSSSPYLRSALGGWPLLICTLHNSIHYNVIDRKPFKTLNWTWMYLTIYCVTACFNWINFQIYIFWLMFAKDISVLPIYLGFFVQFMTWWFQPCGMVCLLDHLKLEIEVLFNILFSQSNMFWSHLDCYQAVTGVKSVRWAGLNYLNPICTIVQFKILYLCWYCFALFRKI